MRGFSRLAALAAAIALVFFPAASHSQEKHLPPNLVYLLADDLGWKDVSYHGSEIQTPNIDKLAASGVRLEQFYAMPVCTPTRASLMTGRYAMRYGLQSGVITEGANYGLSLAERTLAQGLHDAGYETAIAGKWHLGDCDPAYLPTQRGFDHQYGQHGGEIDYYAHTGHSGAPDWFRDDQPVVEKGYSTDLLAAEAVKRIREHDAAKPLFLYVAFNAPHTPLSSPEKYRSQYANLSGDRGERAAAVSCMDDAIGRILAALEERGMAGNTLVVFSSDNGGPTIKGAADNAPLRGEKAQVYEGGVRVPAIAVWPGRLQAGATANGMMQMVDWYPTLLDLAGASREQKLPLDGVDVWPALAEGKAWPRQEMLLNTTPTAGAVRVGDWKLVISHGPRTNGGKGGESVELFNLAEDPGERKNLAEAQPEKVKELRARYEAYASEAERPKNTGFGKRKR